MKTFVISAWPKEDRVEEEDIEDWIEKVFGLKVKLAKGIWIIICRYKRIGAECGDE